MSSTNTRISFGIKTSQSNVTYDDILKVWLEADEEQLFEHAWLWDHFIPLRGTANGGALEAWTHLAALAAQTKRLRIGVIVTSNRIRPPAVLAKMAATVDVISRGRLEFGIGAGGSEQSDPALSQIVHREYDAYGIDVVPTRAIGALAEALTIMKRLWAEDEPFDFDGRYYQLKGAICEPKPVQRPRPPIMIGAAGEKLSLRVVAEHADIWNCPTRGDVEGFRRKSAVLDEHCAAIGRDPSEIRRSVQLLVNAGQPAAPATGAQNLPRIFDFAATRDVLLDFIGAGANHLVPGADRTAAATAGGRGRRTGPGRHRPLGEFQASRCSGREHETRTGAG
jgi:alkanesulfonate monooxygenase SsuD/methylene tetrahydromethanopterin reductase-like flavin-dependent oxidoreductase (luciferase family)